MKKKLLIYPRVARYLIPSRADWEVIYLPSNQWHMQIVREGKNRQSEDGLDTSRYPDDLLQLIRDRKPDFVIILCGGCTEAQFNRTDWPKGPKYIAWTMDDFRVSERVKNADLALSGLPTDENDIFMPLFQDPLPFTPMAARDMSLGMIYHSYQLVGEMTDHYRDTEIARVKAVVPDMFTASGIPRTEYLDTIARFRFGLNVGGFANNSLPNYRSFELMAAGVMPISPDNDRLVLEALFGSNTLLYREAAEVPQLLQTTYDPAKLRAYAAENHSLQARLKEIFRRFFDLDFPLVDLI